MSALSAVPSPVPSPSSGASRKPASERRIRANRENAKKSTGPRTPEGKARASLNRLVYLETELHSRMLRENAGTFAAFARALRADLKPVGFMQVLLVERIVDLSWKLRRVSRAQSRLGAKSVHEYLTHIDEYVKDCKPQVVPAAPDGVAIVLDSAIGGDQEAGAYLRLDLYADRLQRALMSALRRLRQEQDRQKQMPPISPEAAGEEVVELTAPEEDEPGVEEQEDDGEDAVEEEAPAPQNATAPAIEANAAAAGAEGVADANGDGERTCGGAAGGALLAPAEKNWLVEPNADGGGERADDVPAPGSTPGTYEERGGAPGPGTAGGHPGDGSEEQASRAVAHRLVAKAPSG